MAQLSGARSEIAVRNLGSASNYFERVSDFFHLVDPEITDEMLVLAQGAGRARMRSLLEVLQLALATLDSRGEFFVEQFSGLCDRFSGLPWTLLEGDVAAVSDELDEMTKDFPDAQSAFDLWEARITRLSQSRQAN